VKQHSLPLALVNLLRVGSKITWYLIGKMSGLYQQCPVFISNVRLGFCIIKAE
jgi:hypothetical protein